MLLTIIPVTVLRQRDGKEKTLKKKQTSAIRKKNSSFCTIVSVESLTHKRIILYFCRVLFIPINSNRTHKLQPKV